LDSVKDSRKAVQQLQDKQPQLHNKDKQPNKQVHLAYRALQLEILLLEERLVDLDRRVEVPLEDNDLRLVQVLELVRLVRNRQVHLRLLGERSERLVNLILQRVLMRPRCLEVG
jgi:hypothetical protein